MAGGFLPELGPVAAAVEEPLLLLPGAVSIPMIAQWSDVNTTQ